MALFVQKMAAMSILKKRKILPYTDNTITKEGFFVDHLKIKRQVLCIDLKSFFASVECALRGLDPFKTPLIVADEGRGGGSIVLAVSPYLKQRGMPSRCRLFEVGDTSTMMVARPQMRAYVEVAIRVVDIYLRFVSEEDLHVYSIDEAFLDVTNYLAYYGTDVETLARQIVHAVHEETGVPASCGIGDNMLLSKLALDLFSKQSKDGFATLRYDDVESTLWPIRPLSKIWGIGARMERRLEAMNLYTLGDVARADRRVLHKRFGILGDELYFHAHGIDTSRIRDKHLDLAPMKSVGLGQTLFRDYDVTDIEQIFIEMCDEVAERLRFVRKHAKTVHLGIGYSKSVGGGFSHQRTLDVATDDNDALLAAVRALFAAHGDDAPIRQVFIRATRLVDATAGMQTTLFETPEQTTSRNHLWRTIDEVRRRFGKNAVARLSSHQTSGTYLERSGLIGGHRE